MVGGTCLRAGEGDGGRGLLFVILQSAGPLGCLPCTHTTSQRQLIINVDVFLNTQKKAFEWIPLGGGEVLELRQQRRGFPSITPMSL